MAKVGLFLREIPSVAFSFSGFSRTFRVPMGQGVGRRTKDALGAGPSASVESSAETDALRVQRAAPEPPGTSLGGSERIPERSQGPGGQDSGPSGYLTGPREPLGPVLRTGRPPQRVLPPRCRGNLRARSWGTSCDTPTSPGIQRPWPPNP